MIQTFEIEGRLDGLNEYTEDCRRSYQGGGRVKKRNDKAVRDAIKAAGLAPMRTPVIVHITWVEGLKPGSTRFVPRDKDNIRFAAKFVLDALVAEGIIKDDGWHHVAEIADSFRINRNDPRVIVTVEEVSR